MSRAGVRIKCRLDHLLINGFDSSLPQISVYIDTTLGQAIERARCLAHRRKGRVRYL
jgi:hypothetical protein